MILDYAIKLLLIVNNHIVKQVLQKPDAKRRKEGTGNDCG